MTLASTLFYPIFLGLAFTFSLIFIPKKEYKDYFIYGFLLGGVGDVVLVALLQNVLHIMWFKNQGIFNIFGQIALSPPSWTVSIMLFLYFLPEQRYFRYAYIAAWALYSVGYGYMVHNVGLFDFRPWFYPIPSYFLFLGWWGFTAWFFIRTSSKINQGS